MTPTKPVAVSDWEDLAMMATLADATDTVIASVIRNGKLLVPRGDTRLETGDEILAISTVAAEKPLRDILVGPA